MKPKKVLLIEDQERSARMVLAQLRGCEDPAFEVVLHYQYDTAPSLISENEAGFDVVLFGFQGHGHISTARKVLKHADGKAVVMFLLKNNNKRAIEAVRTLGTARFLIKRDVQSCILPRVLEYEMEMAELRNQPADEVVYVTQLKKVSKIVGSLLKNARNPSSIVRIALASLSEASKDNGDFSQYLEAAGSRTGQIKKLVRQLRTKTNGHRGIASPDPKANPIHQEAV